MKQHKFHTCCGQNHGRKHEIGFAKYTIYLLWHYRLWSFKTRDTKLERFLHENQHTQRKLLNFENWTHGEPLQLAKIRGFKLIFLCRNSSQIVDWHFSILYDVKVGQSIVLVYKYISFLYSLGCMTLELLCTNEASEKNSFCHCLSRAYAQFLHMYCCIRIFNVIANTEM